VPTQKNHFFPPFSPPFPEPTTGLVKNAMPMYKLRKSLCIIIASMGIFNKKQQIIVKDHVYHSLLPIFRFNRLVGT
jgi:hypothetical protein